MAKLLVVFLHEGDESVIDKIAASYTSNVINTGVVSCQCLFHCKFDELAKTSKVPMIYDITKDGFRDVTQNDINTLLDKAKELSSLKDKIRNLSKGDPSLG